MSLFAKAVGSDVRRSNMRCSDRCSQDTESLGRSHRSKLGKARLQKAIDDSARILGLPDDYVLGIVRVHRRTRILRRSSAYNMLLSPS